MKNFLCVAMMASCLYFLGCKKDGGTKQDVTGAKVNAERYGVDGAASGKFTSTNAGIVQTTVAGISSFTITAIKDGSNECITAVVLHKITGPERINLIYNNAEGSGITYSKDYTKPSDANLNYKTTNGNATTKGGGELNITKFDGKNVEGTFYFVAVNGSGKEAWAEQGSFSGTIK